MAIQAPKSLLDYYKGYDPFTSVFGGDPSQFGGWYADRQDPNKRYFTDENGYLWMPQIEGASIGDGGTAGYLSGFRTGTAPGEQPGLTKGVNNYFDTNGQFQYANKDDPGWLNPLTGLLAVATFGLGAGALAGAGEVGAGAMAGAGAGETAGTLAGTYGAGTTGTSMLGLGDVGFGAGAASQGAGYGLGAASTYGGSTIGSGLATGAGAAGAGMGMETASEGFGPSFEQSVANGTLDMPQYAADYGSGLSTSTMGSGAGAGTGGTPPPANPYASNWQSMLSNGVQNMGASDWLGLATTALGAYGGAQGTESGQTTQNKMDPRMDPYVYGSLLPNAQGLMNAQMPIAGQNAGMLTGVGRGLLNTPVNPNLQDNPYMTGVADDLQRRTQNLLGNSFQQIQGNSVGVGGLGGSRQGVAQGEAMKGAADSLQGNLSNLYYNQYNADANRNLAKITLGSGLMNQGQQAPWAPLQAASDIYKPYTGLNSSQTTSAQSGGGWQGALGGALGAAQYAKNAGWW